MFKVKSVANTKYLLNADKPVGNAPVVVNLITVPAVNPWLASVISAGLAIEIVQVEPEVTNSPGLYIVKSM